MYTLIAAQLSTRTPTHTHTHIYIYPPIDKNAWLYGGLAERWYATKEIKSRTRKQRYSTLNSLLEHHCRGLTLHNLTCHKVHLQKCLTERHEEGMSDVMVKQQAENAWLFYTRWTLWQSSSSQYSDKCTVHRSPVEWRYLLTYLFTHLLITYLLHAAQSFLKS